MEKTVYEYVTPEFIAAHTYSQYNDLDAFLHACGTSVEKMSGLSDEDSANVNARVQALTDFASLAELLQNALKQSVRNNPPDEDELAKFL
ncbi:MAG: hypothetical protein UDB11_00495 [Peptococcaceae bacterium]|nr:hypothetical protein [Peptococcaceae bacterium]